MESLQIVKEGGATLPSKAEKELGSEQPLFLFSDLTLGRYKGNAEIVNEQASIIIKKRSDLIFT